MALTDCEQALAREPELVEALLHHGKCRHLLLQDGAMDDFNEALRVRPDDGPSRHLGGLTRLMLEGPMGALSDLERAAELLPEDPWVHNSLEAGFRTDWVCLVRSLPKRSRVSWQETAATSTSSTTPAALHSFGTATEKPRYASRRRHSFCAR